MKIARMAVLILCGVLAWSASVPAAEPAPASGADRKAPEASDMDLRWNRDFDLLLDMGNVPTVQQRKDAARRKALLKERGALEGRLADLESRLASIEGSYTSEAVLQEMLRQGVSDMQTAQNNLKREVEQTRQKLDAVDKALSRVGAEPGEQDRADLSR